MVWHSSLWKMCLWKEIILLKQAQLLLQLKTKHAQKHYSYYIFFFLLGQKLLNRKKVKWENEAGRHTLKSLSCCFEPGSVTGKNMYFFILVRDCVSITALHHIQNKLANLNVSKMSLHHKSLDLSKQVAHVALCFTAWHYTSAKLGIHSKWHS